MAMYVSRSVLYTYILQIAMGIKYKKYYKTERNSHLWFYYVISNGYVTLTTISGNLKVFKLFFLILVLKKSLFLSAYLFLCFYGNE